MGCIKAYGGSWGLPDAPTIEDPFAPFRSKNDKDETISTAKCYVSPVVQPPPVSSSPEITVRGDNVAITESQSPWVIDDNIVKSIVCYVYERFSFWLTLGTSKSESSLLIKGTKITIQLLCSTHGTLKWATKKTQACKNYIANVSRVLKFVSTWLASTPLVRTNELFRRAIHRILWTVSSSTKTDF